MSGENALVNFLDSIHKFLGANVALGKSEDFQRLCAQQAEVAKRKFQSSRITADESAPLLESLEEGPWPEGSKTPFSESSPLSSIRRAHISSFGQTSPSCRVSHEDGARRT